MTGLICALNMDAVSTTQRIAAKDDPMASVVPLADAPGGEPQFAEAISTTAAKTTPVQIVLMVLGVIAFLYFARPVILPVLLACMAGMTLKPLIRWSSCCHIPPALSAAVVLCSWRPPSGLVSSNWAARR